MYQEQEILVQYHKSKYGVATKMAWAKLTTKNADGSTSNINTDTFTTSKFIVNLIHILGTPSGYSFYRFNGDSGSRYAQRASSNGASDGTSVNRTNQDLEINDSITPNFVVSYICNILGQEKLYFGFTVQQSTAGAGTAPLRIEAAWKYVPSPDANITSSSITNSTPSNYLVNSNNTVLGTD